MADLDLVYYQDEITSHIETNFPAYDIIEDEVLDGESITRVANRTKPFIVLRWSGMTRNVNNASFTGVRNDEYISDFDLIAVAPQPRMARQVLNYFMNELIGHRLSNGYPLTPVLGQSVFPVAENQASPKLYLAIGTLEFRFTAIDTGS